MANHHVSHSFSRQLFVLIIILVIIVVFVRALEDPDTNFESQSGMVIVSILVVSILVVTVTVFVVLVFIVLVFVILVFIVSVSTSATASRSVISEPPPVAIPFLFLFFFFLVVLVVIVFATLHAISNEFEALLTDVGGAFVSCDGPQATLLFAVARLDSEAGVLLARL